MAYSSSSGSGKKGRVVEETELDKKLTIVYNATHKMKDICILLKALRRDIRRDPSNEDLIERYDNLHTRINSLYHSARIVQFGEEWENLSQEDKKIIQDALDEAYSIFVDETIKWKVVNKHPITTKYIASDDEEDDENNKSSSSASYAPGKGPKGGDGSSGGAKSGTQTCLRCLQEVPI